MPVAKRYSGNGTILKTEYNTDIIPGKRLTRNFFTRDVRIVAPELIGKVITVRNEKGSLDRYMITETEAYRGESDEACHASRGRTTRTEVMFHEGGKVYVYFVYGMYWMLNFVAGNKDDPQAALIRGVEGFNGPGKLTRELKIDKSFYGEDMTTSQRIWVEDAGIKPRFKTGTRIGINYAGEIWKEKPWRYYIESL